MTAAEKRLSAVCFGITLVVFMTILIWGKYGNITGDEMGYSLLCFYMIMPVMSLVVALIMGLKGAYLSWLYPVIFGALGCLIPPLVFGSADIMFLFFSFVPAVLGLGTGTLIRVLRRKK